MENVFKGTLGCPLSPHKKSFFPSFFIVEKDVGDV